MSDKKEIATMHIKISVDTTDLDKLETQLKRIEGLMSSTGLKRPAKQGFTMDFGKGYLEPVFTVSHGVAYVNDTCIEKATLEKVMLQAAKEGAKKAVIAALSETIDINTPVSREEFLELRRIVESELSQLHSSLADIRASMIRSEAAANNRLLQMQKEIDGARSIWR